MDNQGTINDVITMSIPVSETELNGTSTSATVISGTVTPLGTPPAGTSTEGVPSIQSLDQIEKIVNDAFPKQENKQEEQTQQIIEKIQCERCSQIIDKQDQPKHNLEKHNGRPCRFCENKDQYIQITKEYIAQCTKEEKPRMPYLNELAIKLQAHREVFYEWRTSKHDHGEFPYLIKELETIQEFRLQQRIMGRYNPTGGMFLLKTKHGYVETEKRLVAGDKESDPIQIEIIESPSELKP